MGQLPPRRRVTRNVATPLTRVGARPIRWSGWLGGLAVSVGMWAAIVYAVLSLR